MAGSPKVERQDAVNELKRSLILAAARRVFERDGIDGASMRAIGKEAGYTAAAIYFYFESKEAIYAEILRDVIHRLIDRVGRAARSAEEPEARFLETSLAFFDFFAEDARDLEYGFYLFHGGMKPRGLSKDLDAELNALLLESLRFIGSASRALGAARKDEAAVMGDVFAAAVGLLVLKHTRRIKILNQDPRKLMESHLQLLAAAIKGGRPPAAG